MRIIVLSDTHGRLRNFNKVYLKQSSADVFFHLGDGLDEVESMRNAHPAAAFVAVRGNCDYNSSEPSEKLLVLENKRFFLTHGHEYSVKSGLDKFIEKAKEQRADAAIFGHTHQSFLQYLDGMYILNPGSAERPRRGKAQFGVIDITGGALTVHLSNI